MLKFRSQAPAEGVAPPNTIIGIGSSLRGTLMVSGTLRIDGEFDWDDKLELVRQELYQSHISSPCGFGAQGSRGSRGKPRSSTGQAECPLRSA